MAAAAVGGGSSYCICMDSGTLIFLVGGGAG